jgi:hypothetical protein
VSKIDKIPKIGLYISDNVFKATIRWSKRETFCITLHQLSYLSACTGKDILTLVLVDLNLAKCVCSTVQNETLHQIDIMDSWL